MKAQIPSYGSSVLPQNSLSSLAFLRTAVNQIMGKKCLKAHKAVQTEPCAASAMPLLALGLSNAMEDASYGDLPGANKISHLNLMNASTSTSTSATSTSLGSTSQTVQRLDAGDARSECVTNVLTLGSGLLARYQRQPPLARRRQHKWRQWLAKNYFIESIYANLLSLEINFPIVEHHLRLHKHITPDIRAELFNWLTDLHFRLDLNQETLQMGFAIIDRYLQVVHSTKAGRVYLLGTSALFVAAKYEQRLWPAITTFIAASKKHFTVKMILHMESKIVKALHFNLARPVPIHFLRRYTRLVLASEHEHNMAKYLEELCITDYALASRRPSQIAAAALFLAFHLCNRKAEETCGLIDNFWEPILVQYSHWTAAQLHELTRKMAALAMRQPEPALRTTYIKYSIPRYNGIAQVGTFAGPLIESIISGKRSEVVF